LNESLRRTSKSFHDGYWVFNHFQVVIVSKFCITIDRAMHQTLLLEGSEERTALTHRTQFTTTNVDDGEPVLTRIRSQKQPELETGPLPTYCWRIDRGTFSESILLENIRDESMQDMDVSIHITSQFQRYSAVPSLGGESFHFRWSSDVVGGFGLKAEYMLYVFRVSIFLRMRVNILILDGCRVISTGSDSRS
jgi:hypothetical protein